MHVSKSPNPFLDSKKRIPLRNREYSLGPQLNVTLTPPGLVVSMAKKIPQDVAFRLAQKAKEAEKKAKEAEKKANCLLYTSPSPRDAHESRMPSSA